MTISTRRFCRRPAAFGFDATGTDRPSPRVWIRSGDTPWRMSTLSTAAARVGSRGVSRARHYEAARRLLLAEGGGTLCVFSSVAGRSRAHASRALRAAKAGLTRYLEGLDHRFARRGLRVVCVKPGFVRTAMTDGLPAPPFSGEPEAVAVTVLCAIDRGRPVVYARRSGAGSCSRYARCRGR